MGNLEKLFNHLCSEHGLILVDSEMQEIERIILGTHQPFVFTDWLPEVGWEKLPNIREYLHYKKGIRHECYVKESDKIFAVLDGIDEYRFADCRIPTTREQAEFLFNSFNLL